MGRDSGLKNNKKPSRCAASPDVTSISQKEGKIRIVVADDQRVVLEGIKRILSPVTGMEIVGEAQNGQEAAELVEKLRPDILVTEIAISQMNGIEITRRIKEKGLNTKTLFFTIYSDRECIRKALGIEVPGYILKDDPNSGLAEAIRVVASGATCFSRDFIKCVSEYVTELEKRVGEEDRYSRLSKREREVFKLLAEGRSVKQIAEVLYISPKTVESHKYNIMKKIGINSIGDLVRYAIRKRIIRA